MIEGGSLEAGLLCAIESDAEAVFATGDASLALEVVELGRRVVFAAAVERGRRDEGGLDGLLIA